VTAPGRDNLVDYLDRMLVGPAGAADELLEGLPTKRYLMGILFPREASADVVLRDDQPDVTGASAGDLVAEDPIALSGQWLPASFGLSFYVADGATLTYRVWAAAYGPERSDRARCWRRRPLATEEDAPWQPLPDVSDAILEDRAEVAVRRRRVGQGELVTVSLLNAATRDKEDEGNPADCLFQVGFEVSAGGEHILEYPSVELLGADEEEQELRMLHRGAKTFAVGHGCAVTWSGDDVDRQSGVRTVLIPRHVVHGVTQQAPDGLSPEVLRVARLGDPEVAWDVVSAELAAFADAYATWVAAQEERTDVPPRFDAARGRVLARLRLARDRIREGVALLDDDPEVREAFRLANRALAIQELRRQTEHAGTRHSLGEAGDMDVDLQRSELHWYPFQLAFQLLVLPSLADGDHDDRSVVDLLWFPTGGGKTEAYLAVAATEIFLRRLRDPVRGAGTAVITRYTLRLLTTQQFQRAATTIAACEWLRRDGAAELGDEPITIGLWVGKKLTPNRFDDAARRLAKLRSSGGTNPFQFDSCPWCGTELLPATKGLDQDAAYGFDAAMDDFRIFCPEPTCPFHERLPIQVVDDALFRSPPTLLLGTVDKFARLAWARDGGAFFGSDDGYLPPSLVIQDELHLLSGPLGTTVGVYEAAIAALCEREGTPPKIVASTATIRRSDEQVRGLFAGRTVKLFPPAGLDADDSFFARTDRARDGRLYVGVMAQSHTLATAMVHLASALLQGAVEVDLTPDERDAYWTLVAYHNSLRELGRTMTLAGDDIPARLGGIAPAGGPERKLKENGVVELTGNVGGTSAILERMGHDHEDPRAISLLACTNILSVGVDVSRLGLMVVNGQPKTTSEYIQATSRVGRGAVPGVVVSLYTATKPRDRSHYEAFRPYHQALYRFVEPTSVTPWSPASRDRALHAALVILVRHLGGLADNADAGRFRKDRPVVDDAIDVIMAAVRGSEPEEAEDAQRHLRRLVDQWDAWATKATEEHQVLHYDAGGEAKNILGLLRRHDERRRGWPTLNTMRNVDEEREIWVRGEKLS
jgi:hypothetical protein